MLNAAGRFLATSAVPVLLNAIFMAALWLGHELGWDGGLTLAWAVPIAGVAQLAVIFVAVRRMDSVCRSAGR